MYAPSDFERSLPKKAWPKRLKEVVFSESLFVYIYLYFFYICIYIYVRKLKTTLPSLKPPVKKELRSRVIYKITCPGCTSCYVGQTRRHLVTRFN